VVGETGSAHVLAFRDGVGVAPEGVTFTSTPTAASSQSGVGDRGRPRHGHGDLTVRNMTATFVVEVF